MSRISFTPFVEARLAVQASTLQKNQWGLCYLSNQLIRCVGSSFVDVNNLPAGVDPRTQIINLSVQHTVYGGTRSVIQLRDTTYLGKRCVLVRMITGRVFKADSKARNTMAAELAYVKHLFPGCDDGQWEYYSYHWDLHYPVLEYAPADTNVCPIGPVRGPELTFSMLYIPGRKVSGA